MKITIPVVSLEKGGGTRFLHEIGSGLADYGHEVSFVIAEGKRLEYPVRGKVMRVAQLLPEVMPEGDVILPQLLYDRPFFLVRPGHAGADLS